MDPIEEKFSKLGAAFAPGQEVRQNTEDINVKGEKIPGTFVDFSHGDVDAFPPIPGAIDRFNEGVERGATQAYTEYRGRIDIREKLAQKLSVFTGTTIAADNNFIVTPGTQGALFLAVGSTVSRGDRVAIVEPDYFANRKLVEFFDGEIVPIAMDYEHTETQAGINCTQLEEAFQSGVKLFIFSNPNNPAGVIYSKEEIKAIADLTEKYGVTVIADELYARQVFDGRTYTHYCAEENVQPSQVITIIGPSKTESLSGYRLGVAFGSATIIDRMEKLQAIVSLRAGGYSQAVLNAWFNEPVGWMEERITQHQAIRDDLVALFQAADGFDVRATEAGSYLFPKMPPLKVSIQGFVQILRIKASVIVTPGTEFGPKFTRHIRLNFSQDHEAAVDAVKRIIQVAEEYRA